MKQIFLKRLLYTWLLLGYAAAVCPALAQTVRVEEVLNFRKKKPIKISGSISANATHFSSNPRSPRQAFTYQLNGSLSLSLYELINIPLSFNLNNYGSSFSYPSLPNRLSLHPSYKWVRAHIGDVSMSFSPYTMSGHQFTGLGVELTPGKWQISAMGGRLLRGVDYDATAPHIRPSYERWGYGLKARYEGKVFALGATVFTAKDREGILPFEADALGIRPKGNIALGLEGSLSLVKGLKLSFEYGLSIMQRDLRAAERTYYHAFKAELSYMLWGNTIGLGYERISPDYETLGAYYVNNDYENVTASYSRSLFDGKLSLALSGGVQRDDLANDKPERNKRLIGSANVNFTPNDRLSMSLSASSFQGHRNIKSSFDYINEQMPYDNLDTLSFTQLSNSIDLNLSWRVKQSEAQTHSLSALASYQEAADRQGHYIIPGNLTRFINLGANYGIDFSAINFSASLGVNVSNNYAGRKDMLTYGPTLTLAQRLLKQTLTTGLTLSYNETRDMGARMASIYNLRWHASYRFWKRHSLNASLAYQSRRLTLGSMPHSSSITSLIGYSFSF